MKKINNFTINYLVIVTVPILITGLYAVINLPHISLRDILSTYIALV